MFITVNFQSLPSTSSANFIDLKSGACSPQKTLKDEEHQTFDLSAVQTAHQFVRKFPDSTKAVIEFGPDDTAVAVLLLIQQPNAKTVQVKKNVKVPVQGFTSKEESVSS